MTKPALLSAAAIAVAMLATPALARESHDTSRQPTTRIYVNAVMGERTADARFCTPAPRVGAFATQPWDWDHGNVPCEPAAAY
jgi:hypothetical protein